MICGGSDDYFKMHRGARWNNFLTVSSCLTLQVLPKLTLLALIKAQTGLWHSERSVSNDFCDREHCFETHWQFFKGYNVLSVLARARWTGANLVRTIGPTCVILNMRKILRHMTLFLPHNLPFHALKLNDLQSWWVYFIMPVVSPLWWIWAVPLLRHCLRVAQSGWLIDGRQWLSPLESKHFCVVSPLKVLLS